MEKVKSNPDKLNPIGTYQKYIQECENLKSELALNNKELSFLQQLLGRYFDEIVHTENLNGVRESLMRFQDLCYNCGRLKKRVEDQHQTLVDIINGALDYDPISVQKEQTWIEKCKSSLIKDCKTVKKEILNIANEVIQLNKDNNDLVFQP